MSMIIIMICLPFFSFFSPKYCSSWKSTSISKMNKFASVQFEHNNADDDDRLFGPRSLFSSSFEKSEKNANCFYWEHMMRPIMCDFQLSISIMCASFGWSCSSAQFFSFFSIYARREIWRETTILFFGRFSDCDSTLLVCNGRQCHRQRQRP